MIMMCNFMNDLDVQVNGVYNSCVIVRGSGESISNKLGSGITESIAAFLVIRRVVMSARQIWIRRNGLPRAVDAYVRSSMLMSSYVVISRLSFL